jgi:hypothetical protein
MAYPDRRIPLWLIGATVAAVVVVGWIEWNSRRHAVPPVDAPVPEERAPLASAPLAPASVAPAPPAGNAAVPQQPVQVAAATDLAAKAAEDEAREVEWARMREKTIEVQKKLRAEQQHEKDNALGKDERCMDGVKFKRVSNGWVQTGNC